MAYRVVSEKFDQEKRITWHRSTNWYNMVRIKSYVALLIHGDEIKSFGGGSGSVVGGSAGQRRSAES